MRSVSPIQKIGEERHTRILTAAVQVFSKSSFGNATTDEIARRAHVSKRDIYAAFPDKHAILAGVIEMLLEAEDETFQRVVADSGQLRGPARERLEVIGLALISEILSPLTGFVSSRVTSECVQKPPIGAIYFEKCYARRRQLIAQVLSVRPAASKRKARRSFDANLAAQHFIALVSHLPQLTTSVGMRDVWNPKSIEDHVRSAVDCFLKAYPALA